MWQADPTFWGRTSPVLFPVVGCYFERQSIYKGKTYEMGQHGFARDMDFTLMASDVASLTFELADDETMYFSIGAHPAFNCDLDKDYLKFEKNGKTISELTANIIANDGSGCLSDAQDHYQLENGILKMSDELFAKDALVVEKHQADSVTILDENRNPIIKVTCPTPLFGVWSPTGKHAPFVCIEPWYGRCDRVGFSKRLEEREYGNELAAGATFEVAYEIEAAI
ncbi:aldose 1-epimerase family protein [Agathobacter sp.]|uniref:aldose 1-epimerase family protein n=1 Tax=Agathobacter sp. TaxID=2021311 RepID=UPI00257D6A75|nr:aldose 1-epimerase family protein [Agathobacter sp.]